MPEAIRKVNVIGHLHPDTDSICAAISYAYLKNQIDEPIYEARRAGALNRETAFVLKHFGFEEPPLITSVTPQIKDIVVQKQPGIDAEMSLFAAWNMMQDTKVDTLCITDEDKHLEGLIAVKDVANANMDIFDTAMLSEAQTSYKNIIETLNGTLLLGDPNGRVTKGNVRVGTTPEMMEDAIKAGDIVLVTNRYETQQFAVECDAGCLVICCGANVSKRVIASAERHGCTIITTPYDTFAAARLIGMSVPVRAKMLRKGILQFSVNTSVDDARKIMAKSRHRFFPVIDEDGSYFGLVSSPNLINIKRKHVILVDHSERSQAVDGLDQAEIMEILDHHRIGTIETNAPVYYRAEPVGCTCTIIYSAYAEAGVEIPPNIAGLMLSLPFAVRPLRFLMGNRVMGWLAAISMNYYLLHQNVAVHLKRLHIPPSVSNEPNRVGEQPWQWQYIGLSLLGAILITLLIEKPCAWALKKLFTRKQKA